MGVWLLKEFGSNKLEFRGIVAGALSYFVLVLLLSSVHIHHRLNVFRWRRTALERGDRDHLKLPDELQGMRMIWEHGGIDWFYILIFIASPIVMWAIAMFVLFSSNCA